MTNSASQSDPLVLAVADAIDREGLIADGDGVVVGVSGGLDSVVLLDVLAGLSDGRRWRLTVAHLNHRLRPTADDDARFVANLAGHYGLPCDGRQEDVTDLAAQTGQSIETAGRMARYDMLTEAAQTVGAACVAVAHHADDNIETVLHRLLRGTHLRGLAGMPIRRPLGETDIHLVRPLLHCRREDILDYAQRRNLIWREDETNTDTTYRRNFIRHELLPLLRDRMNPRVDDALIRLAGSADQAEQHLDTLGRQALGAARLADGGDGVIELDAEALAPHGLVVITYAMRAALEALGASMQAVTADHLTQLAALATDETQTAIALPGGLSARRLGRRITLGPQIATETPPAQSTALTCPGRTVLSDGSAVTLTVGSMDRSAFEQHRREPAAGVELMDADTVVGALSCRPRRNGDSFHPLGAPGRQTVSDFLTNAKAPHALRPSVCCVRDDLGVIYVAPLRIDDRVRITEATTHVLRIAFERSS